MEEMGRAGECFSLKQLAAGGNDLMQAGVPRGREVGRLLERLLDEVIEEKLPNRKEALLARAEELRQEGR